MGRGRPINIKTEELTSILRLTERHKFSLFWCWTFPQMTTQTKGIELDSYPGKAIFNLSIIPKNTYSFTVTVNDDNGQFDPVPRDNVIIKVRYTGLRKDVPKVKNLEINGQEHCN